MNGRVVLAVVCSLLLIGGPCPVTLAQGHTAQTKGGEKTKFRRWTDATGKYEVDAEFVEFKDGKVSLKKEDGAVIGLAIKKLSEADQAWVRQVGLARGVESNPEVKPEGHSIASANLLKEPLGWQNSFQHFNDKFTGDVLVDGAKRPAAFARAFESTYGDKMVIWRLRYDSCTVQEKAIEISFDKDSLGWLHNDKGPAPNLIRFFAEKTPAHEVLLRNVRKGTPITVSGKISELVRHPVNPPGIGYGGSYHITELRLVFVNDNTSKQYLGTWAGKWDSKISNADVVLRIYQEGNKILAQLQPSKDISFSFVTESVTLKANINTPLTKIDLKNGDLVFKDAPGYGLRLIDEKTADMTFDFSTRILFSSSFALGTGYVRLSRTDRVP